MTFFETFAVAFGMFSAVPVPQPQWNEKNMRYSMCAFPMVGVVCGLAWWGWAALCGLLTIPLPLKAAGFCLLPVLVSGGIHLDGYADTCDALASFGSTDKKLEILSDPRCGAFAVIRLCCYFISYAALCAALETTLPAVLCMGLGFILERALSGFAVASFPLAKNTGLVHAFASSSDKRVVRRFLLLLASLLGIALVLVGGIVGAAMLLAALAALWRYHRVAMKQFGGISGDLAGWFVQRAELWMLAALVAVQILERKLL